MFYCPKCQQTYDEGAQRFCSNDGGRLLPSPASGKSVNQSSGVFTNLLGRVAPRNENDEKLSSTPKFVRVQSAQTDFLPLTGDTNLKSGQEFSRETEEPPTQKPLPRIIKANEVPPSQARLGDRKTNPTGRLAFTPENPKVLIGQNIKGRYRITGLLAQDETTSTYSAEDKIVPNKKVVVQVLMDKDEADHFTNKIFAEERVSLSLINHPNIARILDSGELLEGNPFIVSEFTEGESVRELLLKTKQVNALRTARIISQTADALSAAHQNGVLHRNLKPEDIILTISEVGNEQVRLTNFGISKDRLTNENIAYKSPEQLDGKLANYAGDIYSLAVITFQMLTGRLPFSGLSAGDLQKSQRSGLHLHPTNLRMDLPLEIDDILEKGLSFNPSDRYPRARDFGDALTNSLKANKLFEADKTKDSAEIITKADTLTDRGFDTPTPPPLPTVAAAELSTFEPVVYQPTITSGDTGIEAETNENTARANEELPWEKRSPEPARVSSSRNFALVSILGGLILLAAVWGLWTYFLNRPHESEMVTVPTESVFPAQDQNSNNTVPATEEIEVPPLPRTVPQPPNTVYFQNSKDKMKGDLAKNFLGFSTYYPKDWKQNDAKKAFLDVSKTAPSGTPIEQMLVGYYDSKGTFKSDTESFPTLVKETNAALKDIVPNYKMVSEGRKTVNNGWQAYEVRFTGSGKTAKGENIDLWGRRLFIPPARPGMKNGYVVTMLATSLSPDVKGIEDVGVKGELSSILESFEPNQNF